MDKKAVLEQLKETKKEKQESIKQIRIRLKQINDKIDNFNYEDIESDITGAKKLQYENLIKQKRNLSERLDSLVDQVEEQALDEIFLTRSSEFIDLDYFSNALDQQEEEPDEQRGERIKKKMRDIEKIKKERENQERQAKKIKELRDQGVKIIGGRGEFFGDIIPETDVRRPRYMGGRESDEMKEALKLSKLSFNEFIDAVNKDLLIFIDMKIPILSSLGNIGVINTVPSAFQALDVLIYNFISFYDNQVKFYQPPVYDEKDIETINLIKKQYIKLKSEGEGLTTYEDNLYKGLKIKEDNLYMGLLRISVLFNPLLEKLDNYNKQSIESKLEVNNDYQFINSNRTVQDLESLNMFKDPILRQQKIKEYEERKVDILGDMVNMEDVDKLNAYRKFINENLLSEIQYAKIVYNDERQPLDLEDITVLNKINQERQNKFFLDWEKKKYGVSPLNAQGTKDPSVINAFNQITQSMLNNSITNEKVREIQNLNTAKNPNLKYTYTYPFGIPSSQIKIEKGRFCVYQDGKKTEFSDYFKARLYALSGGVYEKKLKSLTNAKQLVSLEPKKFNLIPFVIK